MNYQIKQKILELLPTFIDGIQYIKNADDVNINLILSDIQTGINTITQVLENTLAKEEFNTYEQLIRHIKKLLNLLINNKSRKDFSNKLDALEILIKELETLLKTESKSHNKYNVKHNSLKKVLIIAYYFPPLGGSGVQRTLKFVKYLRDFGWEPVIVTVDPTNSKGYFIDRSLEKELPSDIEIFRIKVKTQINFNNIIKIYQEMNIDNYLIEQYLKEIKNTKQFIPIPDPFITFAYEAIVNIPTLVNLNEIDVIYSTSGPYSDHIVGYFLKTKYRKPWVVDFRDEWSNNPYVNFDSNNLYYKFSLSLESKIVNLADKVINVSPLSTKNYEEIFQVDRSKLLTITNGYDEMDFNNLKTNEKQDREYFTLFHNGLFYMIRTPETIIRAINNLISSGKIEKEKIKVDLGWTENQEYWEKFIKNYNLQDIVFFGGYLEHNESLEKAQEMDALILVVGPGEKNKVTIPGKFFEYLRLQKPILSLSPKGGVVDQLITELKRGINVEHEDIEAIEQAILTMYNDWQNGNIGPYDINEDIKQFERKNLTKKLANVFNELIE